MSASISNRSDRPAPPPRLLIAAGGVGGIVGALLGGGTGMVAVPALSRYTSLARGVVHGTVTMPNTAVALIGTAAYAFGGGAVDLRVGVPMIPSRPP